MIKIFNRILEGWCYFFIVPFLFVAHSTSFFLYNRISLLSQEYLVSSFLIFILCVPFGLLMVFGGKIIRIATAATVVSLFIISLIDDSSLILILDCLGLRFRYVIIILLIGISIGLYFIRNHLDKFLFLLLGCFFAGSFFTSGNPSLKEQTFNLSNVPNDLSLPPYIHIILDEHIGIEGIPPEEDMNNEFANALKKRYINNGFQVYGRAYSRYALSINSFACFLGLRTLDDAIKYFQGNSTTQHLLKNRLFDELSKKGYHINVMQSSYLDLCTKNEKQPIKRLLTYSLTSPSSLNASDSILLMFSSALTTMRLNGLYLKAKQTRLGKVLNLPKIKDITNQTSSEAAYNVFPEVIKLLKGVEMGNAYFIHLMLPHRPYRFNKECSLMSDRTPIEAETNYQYYLDQIACTQLWMMKLFFELEENTNSKNSTIVIHGDHGSRLTSILGRNMIQSFSTFFAVRRPGYEAGYNARPVPLDYLLHQIILGKEPDHKDNDGIVYLQKEKGKTTGAIPTLFPPFSKGLPAVKWE